MDLVDFKICICGGWAVYFTVNEFFKKQKDMNYIGSQDIDIGFSIEPMMGKTELESTNLFKMVDILEQNGYEPSMFGYKKDITFKDVDLSEDEGKENTFTLYVDILVNSYPPSYQDIHQHSFFEIPLIENIYNDKKNQVKLPNISKHLFIPTREMIGAMKMLSLPSRGEHHKMIKDICDLYALIWFADKSPNKIVDEISGLLEPISLERLKGKITKNLIEECEYYLGEPEGSINTVMSQFI